MSKKVLLVTTVQTDDARLLEAIGDAREVRIVAPATMVSKLAWLANDEDDARREAAQAANRTADALAGTANVTIDRTSHEADPAEAIADTLRNFDADDIVVVTSPDDQATWLEDETVRAAMDSSGLPVRHIQLPALD
jgi:nucleotide-binding universal stress UspA family protein